MNLFSVRDFKAAVFKNLFTEHSPVDAIRGFDIAINDRDSQYKRFPDDFGLFHMGSVDMQTGVFTIFESPRELTRARQLLRESPLAEVRSN